MWAPFHDARLHRVTGSRPPLRNSSTRTTAAISYSIVRAEAGTILDKGAYMGFLVNSGMHA